MNSKVSIIKCKNYESDLVLQSIRQAIDLLGGIKSFVKPQSKVLVKPNLLMAKEPEAGVTTHPEVVRAVIKLLKEINCSIFVGDSPSAFGKIIENVDEVYRISGVEKVCREEGVNLVKFDKKRMYKKFPLTTWLDDCDCLINIPKFKTHQLTLLTGAIKNLYGLVSGTFKVELHKNYFHAHDFANILADIYQEAKPVLTVVDGVVAMEGDGPATAGKLCNPGLIFAGSDCVAIDVILALIMGIKPFDVLSTKVAAGRGLGVGDIDNILVLGERIEEVRGKPFLLPSASLQSKLPKPVVGLIKKLIRYRPFCLYDKCIRCEACIKTCPTKVISMQAKGIQFNYKNCIACFCCQEVCPATAIKVKKSILARLIGL